VDAVLGCAAALFPGAYLSAVHPGLPQGDDPIDWVVRTGVIWLMFLVFEVFGAFSAAPGRWFFCVAMIRWMEVPADIAYGVLARGASPLSQAAIFTAPAVNAITGALLLAAFRQESRLPAPPGR
jgi:hypothetical protein